jgi:release factor glutamine methyltransferase
MSSDGVLTWRALWVETTARLGGASHEARWMCEEASGRDGLQWITGLDDPPTHRAVVRLDAMVERRVAGEPLQYVLGHWPFRTLDLLVDRRVLVPRPETEEVAGVVLGLARDDLERRGPPLFVADLGTGSGAIGLSIAAELPPGGAHVWLTDRSADALDVARANLAGLGRRGVNVTIAMGDWFEALGAFHGRLAGQLDIVVSNPPYVAADDPELQSTVVEWEPSLALFGGADGLDHVSRIAHGAVEWLRPGGWLVLEIGARQGAAALGIASNAGLVDVAVRQDLADLDRVLLARRAP